MKVTYFFRNIAFEKRQGDGPSPHGCNDSALKPVPVRFCIIAGRVLTNRMNNIEIKP
jgi:hypothetical protein